MLYQDKPLGRHWIGSRLASWLLLGLSRRRYADLDLLALNAHLQRDLGLRDGQVGASRHHDALWK